MSLHADQDLGLHQGRRRILENDSTDCGLNQTIAAGAFADSNEFYAPGFTHFMGQLATDTPISTTLSIRIVPRIIGTLEGGGLAIDVEEFVVANITTVVGLHQYCFYWGESRGLLAGALATGATYSFSALFRIRIRNTGAQPANSTSLDSVVFL